MHAHRHNSVFWQHTAPLLWRHKLRWTLWTRKKNNWLQLPAGFLCSGGGVGGAVIEQLFPPPSCSRFYTEGVRVTCPTVFLPSCFLVWVYFGNVPDPYRKEKPIYVWKVQDKIPFRGINNKPYLGVIVAQDSYIIYQGCRLGPLLFRVCLDFSNVCPLHHTIIGNSMISQKVFIFHL